MAGGAPDGLELRLIKDDDRLRGLSLGDAALVPLKTFLEKQARRFQKDSLARTYGVFNEGGKIVAYITLVCGEIVTEEPLIDPGYAYKSYPAVKIARLAVDRNLQRGGVGRSLVEFALGVTLETVCPSVGCRFVVVDAKRKSVAFYERCGFKMLDTEDNRGRDAPVMFVDLPKLPI